METNFNSSMASETFFMGNQKGNKSCEEHSRNQAPQTECKNSSKPCDCSGKSNLDSTTGSICLNESFDKERILGNFRDGPIKENSKECHVEGLVEKSLSQPRTVSNANDNGCQHEDNGCCGTCSIVHLQQCARLQKGNTLQDLYTQEYDDEDDDDSDWEPIGQFAVQKWFCTNCTMPNFDDISYCEACGENKDSECFSNDLFQSFCQAKAKTAIDSETVHGGQGSSVKGRTAIGFDERMLLHAEVEVKPNPHPERPDRLRAIASSLGAAGIYPHKCHVIPAREITKEELLLVHSLDHFEAVEETSRMLSSYFTSDTYANEHSAFAARLAAGFCADIARAILSGRVTNGFALVRPPGHHAGIKQAMGFCLHNNAAVAALAAQTAGAKRVLIVDWDVHHGNGTQEIFDGNKSVLYISLHRHENGRFYPGTGAVDEVGVMDAKGFSVNIPWSRGGVGDNDYIYAFQHVVLPIASNFNPDITIVSAGFDAARGDPLGCCDVTPDGFGQMTHMLNAVSKGKLLVILEGGYNLRSISSSATAVVKVLLGEAPNFGMSRVVPSKAGLQTILQVLEVQLKYWPILQPSYILLQSQWQSVASNNRNHVNKRKRFVGPVWWRWGSKRFVYKLLYGSHPRKRASILTKR